MKRISAYSELVATTLSGLETVCAEEITALGGVDVEVLSRAVRFKGDQKLLYRLNYECRTALRILMPLAEFSADSISVFHEALQQIDWEKWFGPEKTIAVDTVGSHPMFTNTLFASQKCKDAIADRFRGLFDRRPSVDIENADVRIHLHLHPDLIRVSLDSSGTPLFKRAYRKATVQAPLNEVLAAGLIRLSGWDEETPFFDPFCGSGTIPIEASMIQTATPAGKFRLQWSFLNWKDFDSAIWATIKSEADAKVKPARAKIFASDIDVGNLNIARRNIDAAGFTSLIHTHRSAFEEVSFPETPGLILTNPPYGERLREFDLVAFYKKMGDILKRNCAGYQAWIIGSDLQAIKFIGLKPNKKIPVFNGQLECRFLHFSLFSGKRKDSIIPASKD